MARTDGGELGKTRAVSDNNTVSLFWPPRYFELVTPASVVVADAAALKAKRKLH